jgi:hypothetical protein
LVVWLFGWVVGCLVGCLVVGLLGCLKSATYADGWLVEHLLFQ